MGKTVELTAADGHAFNAYVAEPSGTARGVIVVVQEIFGVNSHIRQVADGYAAQGYLAIAPALFDRASRGYESGYSGDEVNAGVAFMKKVDWDMALNDVGAAVAYGAGKGKVGIVGYCWGGAVAWVSAARLPGLSAAVCYYGGAIPSLLDETLKCPVMLHFGENDTSIPLEKAQEIARRFPQAEAHFYPAGHGFNCDQRGSYDETSAALALTRTLAFFKTHVG